MAKQRPNDEGPGYISKKCHACYTYVPLDADNCPYCNVRLGKVSQHGMADKVVDWKSYVVFLVAFVGFVLFMLYAFF